MKEFEYKLVPSAIDTFYYWLLLGAQRDMLSVRASLTHR